MLLYFTKQVQLSTSNQQVHGPLTSGGVGVFCFRFLAAVPFFRFGAACFWSLLEVLLIYRSCIVACRVVHGAGDGDVVGIATCCFFFYLAKFDFSVVFIQTYFT